MDPEIKKAKKGFREVRLRGDNLDAIQKRLLRILARDTAHLMRDGERTRLDKDGATAVVNYLKLVKSLKEKEAKEEDAIPDEELARIAAMADKEE